MNKIIVSGGEGHLAKALSKYDNIIPINRKEMNVHNKYDIMAAIRKHEATHFIHAGALTRPISQHDLDIDSSIKTNIIGTANVVMACNWFDTKLIYISTDYVYPGTIGNYSANNGVLPFTNYGWSKLGGECSVAMYKNSLIIRIALCEKPFPHEYAWDNVYKSYIYHEDAAPLILKNIDKFGIINICGKSQSIYNFTKNKKKHICTDPNILSHNDTTMV